MISQNIIIAVVLFLAIFFIASYLNRAQERNTKSKAANKRKSSISGQIKISELPDALISLQNGQTEFDFIGITSNGTDCIYFMSAKENFNIDFEAMTQDQLPYIKKLEDFAIANNLKSVITTYDNQPDYESNKPAPVIRIEANYSLQEIAKFGEKVQGEVFENNSTTVYEIVP